MSKTVEDCYAPYVLKFLEDNWHDFVDELASNYDEDAEDIAEEICKSLR